jgi:hypothetical protein
MKTRKNRNNRKNRKKIKSRNLAGMRAAYKTVKRPFAWARDRIVDFVRGPRDAGEGVWVEDPSNSQFFINPTDYPVNNVVAVHPSGSRDNLPISYPILESETDEALQNRLNMEKRRRDEERIRRDQENFEENLRHHDPEQYQEYLRYKNMTSTRGRYI